MYSTRLSVLNWYFLYSLCIIIEYPRVNNIVSTFFYTVLKCKIQLDDIQFQSEWLISCKMHQKLNIPIFFLIYYFNTQYQFTDNIQLTFQIGSRFHREKSVETNAHQIDEMAFFIGFQISHSFFANMVNRWIVMICLRSYKPPIHFIAKICMNSISNQLSLKHWGIWPGGLHHCKRCNEHILIAYHSTCTMYNATQSKSLQYFILKTFSVWKPVTTSNFSLVTFLSFC